MRSKNSQPARSGGKQRVLVNFILDKSGSMSTKVNDVIGGFNLYLDELAKEPAVDYGFSLSLFDTVVEMKYKAVPLAKVAKLDDTTYRPSGNTALLDAVGNTVQTASTDGFDKTITVIQTDGEENSSREWTLQAVRELIRRKEAAGNWTFVFMGANLEAFAQGANLGVPVANTSRYDPANYQAVFASLAKSTNAFAADAARSVVDFFKGESAGIKNEPVRIKKSSERSEAAKKAWRTRKLGDADRHAAKPHRIRWVKSDGPLDNLGHGVQFLHEQLQRSENPVAFLEGFNWRRCRSATVRLPGICPASITPDQWREVMKTVREAVRVFLSGESNLRGTFRHGPIRIGINA